MNIFSKLIIVSLASFLLVSLTNAAGKEVPQFIEGTVRISAEEMIELVENFDNLVIIDARKASDIARGTIEGAISLPNTKTSGNSLAKNLASKITPVIFYCNGIQCGRSMKSAKIAVAEGYSNIYWFRGGMQEWEAKGLPVIHPQ